MPRTVIVGAGVAGVQTALELRHRAYAGEIVLVGEEPDEPYDRPPLSKAFLKGAAERPALVLLPMAAARDKQIDVQLGTAVSAIRPAVRAVELSDGRRIEYDHLVLATGSRNRSLPVPGADLPGVWSLRGVDEADGLRKALGDARDVVIVGGGFIGLEVAAVAQAGAAHVTVVEFLPRVMARALSPHMSEHFTAAHRTRGVDVLTGVGVAEVLPGPDGSAAGVRLDDGRTVPADVVVVGVGVLPETDLAAKAGLRVADGVFVDNRLRTSDPRILAVGDCARFECVVSGRELRLESIQNAADQARFAAAQIVGDEVRLDGPADTYAALPWFWSEQYDLKLQIAGAAPPEADSVLRGDPDTGSFSVCRYVGDRLVAVESVNHARDHLGARKLLAAPRDRVARATRAAVADATLPLKALLHD